MAVAQDGDLDWRQERSDLFSTAVTFVSSSLAERRLLVL